MRAALLGLLLGGLLLSGSALAAPVGPATSGTMSGGTLPPLPEAETPPVARDLGVAELPLLVTEPPEKKPADVPAPVTGGADSTLNPFSPLLPQPEAAEPTPAQPATRPPVVTEPAQQNPPAESVTAAAEAAETSPITPAPAPQARPVTPPLPASLGVRMGRRAANGVLRTGILERALGGPGTAQAESNPLAEMAAIRAPSSLTPSGTAAPTRVAARSGGAQETETGLTPIGLAENTATASNRVSRSLNDLRVSFTAMATGTGIFRVGDGAAPTLVAVGERLPGTELVLSRLTAGSAQFTEDDARHTLSLNP